MTMMTIMMVMIMTHDDDDDDEEENDNHHWQLDLKTNMLDWPSCSVKKSLCGQDVEKKATTTTYFHNVIDICRSSAHHKFWTCNLFTSLARTQNHNFQLGIASTAISGTHWRQCAIEGHRTWGHILLTWPLYWAPWGSRHRESRLSSRRQRPLGGCHAAAAPNGSTPQQRWKVQCCQYIWVNYMV